MTKNVRSVSIPQMKEYLKDKKIEKYFGGRFWIVKKKEGNNEKRVEDDSKI